MFYNHTDFSILHRVVVVLISPQKFLCLSVLELLAAVIYDTWQRPGSLG